MTKIALVTGANRGIGLEIVKGLSKQGHKVLMAVRDVENAKEVIADEALKDVHPIELDLTDENSVNDGVTKAQAVFGRVDILVNNAGVFHDDDVQSATLSAWNEALQTHLTSPFLLAQALLPEMKSRGFGRVVNLSSGWGSFDEGLEGPMIYAVTKSALNALTVKLAQEINASDDVKVNAMCPGWVHTRMGGVDAPKTPQEGAETAIWLATLEHDGPNGGFFRDKKNINW